MSIVIDSALCVGCGACLGACPFGVLSLEDGIAVAGDGCTLCGACADACPCGAITVPQVERAQADDEHSGVLVHIEHHAGAIAPVSLELLSEGRALARQTGGSLIAACACAPEDSKGTEQMPRSFCIAACACAPEDSVLEALAALPADEVVVAQHESLAHFHDIHSAHALCAAIERTKPAIVLIGATAWGRSLAPRVAARLGTGLTADCTGLSIDTQSGLLLQTRPAFGGNLYATIVCPSHRPQMATVRPGVFAHSEQTGAPTITTFTPALEPDVGAVLRAFRAHAGDGVNLQDCDVIVAVGKGIGKQRALAHELAELLSAGVGATRAAVDAGLEPYSCQIGQTGRTVSPRLYVALGVSGASQHLAGMSAADTIIAVNKDADAPIFSVAHYGVVGDLADILPPLLRALRA